MGDLVWTGSGGKREMVGATVRHSKRQRVGGRGTRWLDELRVLVR